MSPACLSTGSAKARREHYVGTWLLEPLAIGEDSDADEAAIVDETLSMAFLVLLESLTPVEWAVFLRRQVFNYDYEEISRLVGKAEANCRQIARRARETVAARRPRFEASPEQEERLAGSFLEACLSGDMEALLSLLSEDLTLYSDGGGKARAALKPIHGADKVARLLLDVLRKDSPESIHFARINGQPGIIGYLADGRGAGVRMIEASEGRIGAIRFMLNPEKLGTVPPLGQVERKEVPE